MPTPFFAAVCPADEGCPAALISAPCEHCHGSPALIGEQHICLAPRWGYPVEAKELALRNTFGYGLGRHGVDDSTFDSLIVGCHEQHWHAEPATYLLVSFSMRIGSPVSAITEA